jgi:hypothetical protein
LIERHKEEQTERTVAPTVERTALVGAASGVDVAVEETTNDSVSVFYVPSEASLATSVVVWVDETKAN